jgi:hypothetical protein
VTGWASGLLDGASPVATLQHVLGYSAHEVDMKLGSNALEHVGHRDVGDAARQPALHQRAAVVVLDPAQPLQIGRWTTR